MIKLIIGNLLAHPLRNILTTGAVFFAVALLGLMHGIVTSLSASVEQASQKRLWVQSAVSLFVDLPLSYESKIDGVEGVEFTSKWQWFGGIYKDEANFFAQFGVDADTFLEAYKGEIEIVGGDYEKFSKNRTGCVIGQDLADTFGFKVGQTIPIIGRIFPRTDGSAWDFKVEAIYQSTTATIDQNTLYFHYDYLKESLESGATPGDVAVGVYLAKIEDDADPAQVIASIDTLFDKGPQRVQTTTEADFSKQFISMLGNIPLLLKSIGTAVLIAIFFAVLNTMLTIGHERTRDIGIMKALGFRGSTLSMLLVYEALLVSLIGGVAALGFLKLVEPPLQKVLTQQLPGFSISTDTALVGIGIAAGVGILAGLAPGLRIRRLSPLQALRGEG